MTKQYRKNKRRICVVICLVLCMISGIKIQAAQPGYFDNPQTVYDEFAGKIYDRSFKKSYAFLKKKMNVYETSSGSKKIGVAPRYSGVIVVSKTSDHVQVIYEKKKAYGIGWIDRGLYHKEAIPYNGNEKQLLGNGTYWIQNKASGEGIRVQIIFLGNQKYQVSILNQSKEDHTWKLIREYDHFYIKNMKNEKYLSMDENGTLTDGKIKDMNNCFTKPQKEAAQKSYQWQVMRLNNKNVYPYRDFMQFDPAWARKDYGNVSDYSGKMAAAGCGVVAITNAVYALNGQFVDPMLFADYAVEKHYRIIGAGTHDGIFKAAAKKFGDTYGFTYIKTTYSTSEVREYLKKGCVAISHVPGHYVTVADFNPKTKKYLVLDSHPIKSRPTGSFGNWFKRERLERGGLTSSAYYIYGVPGQAWKYESSKGIQFQKDLFTFMIYMR
jgi:hypothetical protein